MQVAKSYTQGNKKVALITTKAGYWFIVIKDNKVVFNLFNERNVFDLANQNNVCDAEILSSIITIPDMEGDEDVFLTLEEYINQGGPSEARYVV